MLLPPWLSSVLRNSFLRPGWRGPGNSYSEMKAKSTHVAGDSQKLARSTTCWSRVTWLTWARGVLSALAGVYKSLPAAVYAYSTLSWQVSEVAEDLTMAVLCSPENTAVIYHVEYQKRGGLYSMRKRDFALVRPKHLEKLDMFRDPACRGVLVIIRSSTFSCLFIWCASCKTSTSVRFLRYS